MAVDSPLTPTLYIEIRMNAGLRPDTTTVDRLRTTVSGYVQASYISVTIGQEIVGFGSEELVDEIIVADYTGPDNETGTHRVACFCLDVQAYVLRKEPYRSHRRSYTPVIESEAESQARVLELPNVTLKDDWDSLVYDQALPSRLLRYVSRMLLITRQPGLNLRIFNWNRLCLLHGPPGSGKSTLCRALAQKLAIRLASVYTTSQLVEVDTNSLSSKFFGESGKLISSLFSKVKKLARSPDTLVCVVIDEIETIAASREQASTAGECNDGIRATNQLLMALDQIRVLSNILILCTSNLTTAIDPAFLDRVDMVQIVPPPSAAAIYNIFRSCLNELAAADLITAPPTPKSPDLSSASPKCLTSEASVTLRKKVDRNCSLARRSADQGVDHVLTDVQIPSFAAMIIRLTKEPHAPASRVWALAQRCEGLSGRSLRRLPLLSLAMHTWGEQCSMHDVITAMETAISEGFATNPIM